MTLTVKVKGLRPAVMFDVPDHDIAVRMACKAAIGVTRFPTTAWVWDGQHRDMKDGEGMGYRVELVGLIPDFGLEKLQ